MKGIILAGGTGSRLYPATIAISKQLLPVFDKPMIYYPLSVLMLAGIRDILIISSEEELPRFKKLFYDGSFLGLNINYMAQKNPEGLAQAFIIGEDFIGTDSVAMILGDNIFYGHNFSSLLSECTSLQEGGIVFGYRVNDPQHYGVVEFGSDMRVIGLEEKPLHPKSHYVVPGLYFYDNEAVSLAKSLKPSKRGELEITDLSLLYLKKGNLRVKILDQGYAWLDMGTHDALQKAAIFVQTIQERQGIKIACLEEIAYQLGYIDREALLSLASRYSNDYGKYLRAYALIGKESPSKKLKDLMSFNRT